MDENNNLIFGKRVNPNNAAQRSPHPALIGGTNPKVKCAGILECKDRKIYRVNNQSGHYKPNVKSLDLVEKILQELYRKHPKFFHEESKWSKQNNIP